MANVPGKTQEERAAEKKAKRTEKILRLLKELADNRVVGAQLQKQLDEEVAALCQQAV